MNVSNKTVNLWIKRYLHPFPIILSLGIIGVISVSLAALVNHMDVPTFIASFSTKQVTVADFQQDKIQKPVILIDVRTPEEYAEDHIGKSLLVPIAEIENGSGVQQIQAIAKANSKPNRPQPTIVLYCTRGPRSTKAYKLLEKTGLNFVVLKGGITAWRENVPAAKKDVEILGWLNSITIVV
jgi:rhodanese-related sulfurtransferase